MLPSIEHPQGADRDYDFTVLDQQGEPENITGWTFAFTLWNDLAEAPVKALELTSPAGGISVEVAESGIGRIRILASAVADLAPGRYRGQLSCEKGGGQPDILATCRFILVPDRPST